MGTLTPSLVPTTTRAAVADPQLDDLQPSVDAPTSLRHRLTYLDALNRVAKPITEVVTTKVEKIADDKSSGAEGVKGEDAEVQGGEVKAEDVEMTVADPVPPAATSAVAVASELAPISEMVVDEQDAAGPSYVPFSGNCDNAEISGSATPPNEDNDKTLDRYIVDYLLRTRRIKAAKALADKQGIEQLVDLKLFAELLRIQKALVENRSVTEALAWCGENRGSLKKTKVSSASTLACSFTMAKGGAEGPCAECRTTSSSHSASRILSSSAGSATRQLLLPTRESISRRGPAPTWATSRKQWRY